jgi:release factor glutamine methyltransferase
LAEFLKDALEKLKQASVANPQLDARLLAGYALDLDRAQMLSQSQRILMPEECGLIESLLTRRAAGEPVARIIGHREFWGLNFGLNEATLEPRPDSETLIEAILSSFRRTPESSASDSEHMSQTAFQFEPLLDSCRADSRRWIPAFAGMTKTRILDLGTGTGCLLLSLLHELPTATGIGIDINPRAVDQASKNAAALNLDNRAEFRTGEWLNGIAEKFDIIISNPPYIPTPIIPTLMREVRDYDPLPALDGGADGLAPYRLLIPKLPAVMNPGALAAFEVGRGQARQVEDLFQQNGFTNIAVRRDLSGVERCVTADRQD